MKLVITIVQDEDTNKLIQRLNQEGFMATKLASTGGFLKTGNTTIFVGVEESKVEDVIEIIKEVCKTTKQMSLLNQPIASMTEGYISYPIEVSVGGATIFVVDVEKYLKI
ncbi:uncharacterized protein YaaQ [Natranaerovirga pectinivora]|uniref:Uncharacterized protein YaaQ n=1 Tax=Natranaerovirga pectinivora TaxID=682400 RepID=A0A4R3MIX4_9FIRM|nr:cyclic-di-AMP receptor [Natranaerovirga pectinivora]TCT11685.1 uncharacterized protein YaaQ [Natranaerovirga pectinivora]